MDKRNRFKDRQILLFSRYPQPGKTKTRLIRGLGAVRSANLQKKLTERIVGVARNFSRKTGAGITLFGEGGTPGAFKKWLGSDIHVVSQSKGDIGRRMAAALDLSFKNGSRQAVLVGSDIPHVTERHFEDAFDALSDSDMVMGPSTDGGYWLIGAGRLFNVFDGIDWGTEKVFAQTNRLIEDLGLRLHCLEMLSDIDTMEDVVRHLPEEAKLKPFISVIIPALNEEANIAGSVTGALDESTEVIVVDGGSSDRTFDLAREAGAKVMRAEEGRAVQQNQGAKQATGEVLLFLHADSRLPEGFARHVFMVLIDPETVLGAFRFKTDLNRPMMAFFEKVTHFRSAYLNLPYGDQGLFMRRRDFLLAGGFPDVAIAEDLLLVRRWAKAGRIKIAPAEVITSGRRWENIGMFRTFVINQIILSGCLLGISSDRLAPLYSMAKGRSKPKRQSEKGKIQ